MAEEIRDRNPDLHRAVLEYLGNAEVKYVPHEEFRNRSRVSRTVVRTGEFGPFANIILYSGVPF